MARNILLIVVYFAVSANGVPKIEANHHDGGSPLFLTPYIESGKIEEARNLSRVYFPEFPKLESYSGFFTVNKMYNSNQFFWYFPRNYPPFEPRNPPLEMPVVLWLQMNSSLYGLFEQHGPIRVKNGTLFRPKFNWAGFSDLVYIDNRVGAGFSFTNDTRGYCTNKTQVAENLYITLIQFFQMFPELQKKKFIIIGEFVCQWITALAYTIHKKNPTAKIKINLDGLAIGNGWCDPINQLGYSDYLYQTGLLDWNAKEQAEVYQNQTIELINKEAWLETTVAWSKLMVFLRRKIGRSQYMSFFNYLKIELSTMDYECEFCDMLESAAIRKAIHVGNLTFDKPLPMLTSLKEDMMKSVAPWISELLGHYRMMFYSGQADTDVPYPLTLNFLRKLNYSEYLNARRIAYMFVFPNGGLRFEIVGSWQKGGNLQDLLIRSAGQMATADQPFNLQFMIFDFITKLY